MVLFPHCKINLGLRVLRRRPDGFHDLESIFYPVRELRDALEMLPSAETTLHISGQAIPGDPATNLCMKAHALLSADFQQVSPVNMYLHKHIPIGAGLGGGSADGAFALMLLNRLFRLGMNREQLLPYAAALGSDCPFFLYDSACIAGGRGEILRPVSIDLSDYRLVLVNPGIHINTGWAFSQLELSGTSNKDSAQTRSGILLPDGEMAPVSEWKIHLHNDFEPAVFKAHPEIADIRDVLYAAGAVYASMTGSGSTVFALFNKDSSFKPVFPAHYWVGEY